MNDFDNDNAARPCGCQLCDPGFWAPVVIPGERARAAGRPGGPRRPMASPAATVERGGALAREAALRAFGDHLELAE